MTSPFIGRLEELRAWAHRGPVRTLVMKVVATIVGGAVILAGVAMLVLPGPGLVVMGVGLAVLATEWPWARRALLMVRAKLVAARNAALPKDGSAGRRAAGAVVVAALAVAGFVATTAVTAVIGATTLM
jgi:uncharacterized protein (TIGR02611 family)